MYIEYIRRFLCVLGLDRYFCIINNGGCFYFCLILFKKLFFVCVCLIGVKFLNKIICVKGRIWFIDILFRFDNLMNDNNDVELRIFLVIWLYYLYFF